MGRIDSYPENVGQMLNTPVTLGYAKQQANQAVSGASGTAITAITGLSVTVTVPEGRRIRVTASCVISADTVSGVTWAPWLYLREGSTDLRWVTSDSTNTNFESYSLDCSIVLTPTAGVHTYQAYGQLYAGASISGTLGSANTPSYILVEDITGMPTPAPSTSVPVGLLAQTSGGNLAAVTNSTTDVDLGVSLNVVVPAGRTLEVYGRIRVTGAAIGDIVRFRIKMDGTTIGDSSYYQDAGWGTTVPSVTTLVSPSAGAHTFTLTFHRETGTGNTTNQGVAIFFVKDVTATPAPTDQQPSSTLGYTEATANQSGITTEVDLTNLAVTINIAAGRRIKISTNVLLESSVIDDLGRVSIREGANLLALDQQILRPVNNGNSFHTSVVLSPSAGSHTYKLTSQRVSGTGNIQSVAQPSFPAFILVEDITGVSTALDIPTGLWAPSNEFPSNPGHGDLFYEKDTDTLWAWNSTAWKPIGRDSGWNSVVSGVGFQNSWLNFDNNYHVKYRRVGNMVSLRGLARSGTVNATIFTLPAGYWPSSTANSLEQIFAVSANSAFGEVRITTATGAVRLAVGSNLFVALDGITFQTD